MSISVDRMAELQSAKALVCRREINCEQGNATVHLVLLADGFLIDCGHGNKGEKRAQILAAIVNEGGPERLDKGALR